MTRIGLPISVLVVAVACSRSPPAPLHHVAATQVAARSDSRPASPLDGTVVHDPATGEFPLPHGKHRIPCKDCHWDSLRSRMDYQLTASCNSARMCHEGDHVPTLGPTCILCHPPRKWDAARFDHDKPFPAGGASPVKEYPLRGKHASVRCDACHFDYPDFTSAKTSCIGCHARDDVHRGSRGADCERCHGEVTWRSRLIWHLAPIE